MVANEILEKVRSQMPGTDSLMSPPKDMKVTLLNFWVRAECTLNPWIAPTQIMPRTSLASNQHQTLGMKG